MKSGKNQREESDRNIYKYSTNRQVREMQHFSSQYWLFGEKKKDKLLNVVKLQNAIKNSLHIIQWETLKLRTLKNI